MCSKKLTDREIIARQERLYQLEFEAGGVFAGRLSTPEEQMKRIKAFLADDYFEKINALVPARRKELEQEIATETDPKKKARLQRNLEQLGEFEM